MGHKRQVGGVRASRGLPSRPGAGLVTHHVHRALEAGGESRDRDGERHGSGVDQATAGSETLQWGAGSEVPSAPAGRRWWPHHRPPRDICAVIRSNHITAWVVHWAGGPVGTHGRRCGTSWKRIEACPETTPLGGRHALKLPGKGGICPNTRARRAAYPETGANTGRGAASIRPPLPLSVRRCSGRPSVMWPIQRTTLALYMLMRGRAVGEPPSLRRWNPAWARPFHGLPHLHCGRSLRARSASRLGAQRWKRMDQRDRWPSSHTVRVRMT